MVANDFAIGELILPFDKLGVNSFNLSKKYSKVYFLIKESFIELDTVLSFFSIIAREDGLRSLSLR